MIVVGAFLRLDAVVCGELGGRGRRTGFLALDARHVVTAAPCRRLGGRHHPRSTEEVRTAEVVGMDRARDLALAGGSGGGQAGGGTSPRRLWHPGIDTPVSIPGARLHLAGVPSAAGPERKAGTRANRAAPPTTCWFSFRLPVDPM